MNDNIRVMHNSIFVYTDMSAASAKNLMSTPYPSPLALQEGCGENVKGIRYRESVSM